jgi:hypothetical protein
MRPRSTSVVVKWVIHYNYLPLFYGTRPRGPYMFRGLSINKRWRFGAETRRFRGWYSVSPKGWHLVLA